MHQITLSITRRSAELIALLQCKINTRRFHTHPIRFAAMKHSCTPAIENISSYKANVCVVVGNGPVGLKAGDYDKVGASLLWTLEAGPGEDFTAEVKEAWTVTYATLSGVMIEGAEYETVTPVKVSPPRKSWFKSLFSPT